MLKDCSRFHRRFCGVGQQGLIPTMISMVDEIFCDVTDEDGSDDGHQPTPSVQNSVRGRLRGGQVLLHLAGLQRPVQRESACHRGRGLPREATRARHRLLLPPVLGHSRTSSCCSHLSLSFGSFQTPAPLATSSFTAFN